MLYAARLSDLSWWYSLNIKILRVHVNQKIMLLNNCCCMIASASRFLQFLVVLLFNQFNAEIILLLFCYFFFLIWVEWKIVLTCNSGISYDFEIWMCKNTKKFLKVWESWRVFSESVELTNWITSWIKSYSKIENINNAF